MFPLGNIYIRTHIIRGSVNYSDNRWGGPTGHPVRDRDAVFKVQDRVLFGAFRVIAQIRIIPRESKGVRRLNNSVGHLKRV